MPEACRSVVKESQVILSPYLSKKDLSFWRKPESTKAIVTIWIPDEEFLKAKA